MEGKKLCDVILTLGSTRSQETRLEPTERVRDVDKSYQLQIP